MTVLPGLPGATGHAGSGEVVEPLLEGILADTGPLADHRGHREAWYGELIGPLRIQAEHADAALGDLRRGDHGLRVTLVAGPGWERPAGERPLDVLGRARTLLVDDQRVEIAGAELPLPPLELARTAAAATRHALDALDLTTPAWLVVPPSAAWLPALDVIAEDGAEQVALHLPPGSDLAEAAVVLRKLVDLDLPVAVTAGSLPAVTEPGGGPGLLNLLGAVRAALNGAEAEEVAAILGSGDADPLAAAARRMSAADAAVVRSFLPLVSAPSARSTVEELEALGLVAPDAA